jgi:hypothetical protein
MAQNSAVFFFIFWRMKINSSHFGVRRAPGSRFMYLFP